MPQNQLIPNYYKNIPTDVIETGEFTACSLKSKIRPVLGGYCISVQHEDNYGSTCCLVSNGVSNFLLSTNHVLANENEFAIGSPIVQTAYSYGGKDPRDTIAHLHKFMPLRPIEGESRPINLTDCALGLLTKPDIVSSRIALISNLKGVKNVVKLNEEVKKVGCGSGLTSGIVTSTHATITIRFNSGNRFLFNDVIFTSQITQTGDSGAILLNKYNYAVAMIFSLNGASGISCYLNTVLDQLDVHLVT